MGKHHGLSVILLLSISLLAHLPQVRATDRQVPDVYSTIQAAVDAADPGDTIVVAPGVYPESVTVEKSLSITGLDKSTTIVDGSGGGYAFSLSADGVTIRGFTLRDCSNYGVLASYSGNHTIDDNIFRNNAYGVYLSNSPSPNNIVNNTFLENGLIGIKTAYSDGNTMGYNYISGGQYGIKVDDESQFNTIANNTIDGTSHGIYVRYAPNNNVEQNEITSLITGIASVSSDYTTIQHNTVSHCASGIELHSSMYNTIFANTAAQNGEGIYLVYASENTITSNIASNNDWGIRLYESDLNMILENTLSFNGYGFDLVSSSTGNTLGWNNILNNTLQVHQDSTSGGNTWYKKSEGTNYGNYWSNYTGEDTDDPPDGVGDTRLPHMGVDYYPLINPWSTVHDGAVVSVVSSDSAAYQGLLVNITVVIRNEGTATETFDVTAKYLNRIIGTETVTNLPRLRTTEVLFIWNTTNVPMGFDYAIKAEVSPVVGETDHADNALDDGIVFVTIPGDLCGDTGGTTPDGDVDRYDFGVFSDAYGSSVGDPNYNRLADLMGDIPHTPADGDVDRYDFGIISDNYGEAI
jgi:nitrous oxidase accessory protein